MIESEASRSAPTALEVRDLVKSFGGLHAVAGASFSIRERSITALIGPNGAGKTTLFNVVSGFYRGDAGSIELLGHEILGEPPYSIAARGMVRTFQITKALARMSVLDNMMLAAPHQTGERLLGVLLRPHRSLAREREVRSKAKDLLELFGLASVANDYAGTLSGGQRKLLELARALMVEPSLLLLDEPMAGVNPTLGRKILAHIERLRAEQGMTILFVEHDMDAVMNHADRVVVMAEGQVLCEGTPAEVQADTRVVDAYLGRGAAPDSTLVGHGAA